MSIGTAKSIVDWAFDHIPDYATGGIEFGFIGGEPLLEFELIKEVYEYTCTKYPNETYIFYATTNGTVLTGEMEAWFSAHKDDFVLGLSIDGAKETHDYNRCNSFDDIDIAFFLQNWPNQGVKMTLSEYSLPRLAENIKYIHECGFKYIGGVNLAEGSFDWSNDEYIAALVPQLAELVDYYVENDTMPICQMLDKELTLCNTFGKQRKKWCGIGIGCPFFDVDGKQYPCSFCTPMTFTHAELDDIMKTDFENDDNFIDDECLAECYIYPLCGACSGTSYLNKKTFKMRDKSRCRIQKLISLFIADLQAKRIRKNPDIYSDYALYHSIEAIKKIKALYLQEYEKYLFQYV